MFGKKKLRGFTKKPRTLEEINIDYNHHAASAGHKARIIREIQAEIDQHIQRMLSINEESKSIKAEPPKETPPTEPSAA